MTLDDGFNLLASAPDGIKRLRELILSLAVQGKLVPQDPNDEPASELLKQIRAEKDRLIAEGKIKKDKPLPAIGDDEKPFALPESWAWARQSDLVEVLNGRAYGKSELLDQGVPVLRVGNLFTSNQWYYSDLELEEDKYCSEGDLIFAWSASFGPFIWQGPRVIYHYHIWKLRLHSELLLDKKYLYTFLQEKTQELKAAGHGVSMVHMTKDSMEKTWIPVPPLAEQSRIVAKVEELMALCDALETRGQLEAEQHARLTATLFDALAASESAHQLQQNWARLAASFDLVLDRPEAVDALEQTLLQLAVRGLLVPQDPADQPASELLKQIRAEKDRLIAEGKIKKDKPLPAIGDEEKPFALPVGWEWALASEIATQITDGAHHTPQYIPEGIPFLSVKNLSSGYLDFSDTRFISQEAHDELSKRCNPELGDILLTKIGTTGIAVVIDDSRPFSIFVSVALLKLPSPDFINENYLALLINSPFVRQQSADGTEGVGNKNLVLKKINSFKLPIPPLAEQSRIVARVEALRALCGQLRQRLAASRDTQGQLASALLAQG